MKYKLSINERTKKSLEKMDRSIAKSILKWMKENLLDCENPRLLGEPLKGEFKGYWKYRKGDYRILVDINDGIKIIEIIKIDHRKQMYNK